MEIGSGLVRDKPESRRAEFLRLLPRDRRANRVRNSAYRLRLTPGWKSIHPVFNECFDSRELPRDENEWIRDEELGNAREAVKTFHRKHPTAPRPQKTMRVRFAGIDAACTCPICLDIPVPAPSGLFQSAEFLAFRAQFNRLPDYMFERPPRPEPRL